MAELIGFWTDYVLDRLNNLNLRGTASSPASGLYLGFSESRAIRALTVRELSTTTVVGGTPTANGYARVSVGFSNFTASVGRYSYNASPILTPTPTIDWKRARTLFLADALTAGNILAIIGLGTGDVDYLTRTVERGALTIGAGMIKIRNT